jgi:hypothetical protein
MGDFRDKFREMVALEWVAKPLGRSEQNGVGAQAHLWGIHRPLRAVFEGIGFGLRQYSRMFWLTSYLLCHNN